MDNTRRLDNLMLITDSGLFEDTSSFLEAMESALYGGVRLVQLREKGLCSRDLLALARRLRDITGRHNAMLFINERADIAKLIKADGLHLPVNAFSVMEARRLMGAEAFIGVSTHSIGEARAAEADGADYVTFSPIYDTPSKARYGAPLGLGPLRELAPRLTIPVYALGGITSQRVREVMKNGASGVALISDILASKEICKSAKEITNELKYCIKNVEQDECHKNLLSRKESP